MFARAYSAAFAVLGSILLVACGRPLKVGAPAPRTTQEWWGCYVVTWTPAAPEWPGPLDSVRLAPTTSLDSSVARWHHIPYATSRHYDQGYFGPHWYVARDTLRVDAGVLSGWKLSAMAAAGGFAGRATTFTDYPAGGDSLLTWTVVARRVNCGAQ